MGVGFAEWYSWTSARDERLASVCKEGSTVRLHSTEGATIYIQNGDAVTAVCQVPVQARNQVCGILTVDRRSKSSAFSLLDEQTLAILAHYASLALVRERVV